MKQTTGATISRLGVLTVLANNMLEENHLEPDVRKRVKHEIHDILDGDAGVPSEKVIQRSMERCVAGGATLQAGPNPFGFVGIGGLN